MGNEASNNACESIVNGSNPRYTYSQPTPSQQVAWQVQKEEKARQEQYAETLRRNEPQTRARLSEPYQHQLIGLFRRLQFLHHILNLLHLLHQHQVHTCLIRHRPLYRRLPPLFHIVHQPKDYNWLQW